MEPTPPTEDPSSRGRNLAVGGLALLLALTGLLPARTPPPPAGADASPAVAGAEAPRAGGAGSDPSLRLYVPNQLGASVSVLDGEGELLTTVDLRTHGFSERAMPHQVATDPDGSAWYATLAGEDEVVKFDHENRVAARAEFESPGMIVLDPTRDRLYVSRALAAVRPPSSIGVFRASDLTLLEEVEVFVLRPHGLAVDTVSGRVYTGSIAGGQLAAYDPETDGVEVTHVEEAPHGFVGLSTSPDGTRLVATTQLNDRLLAFDATGGGELSLVATVPVAAGPYDVTFGPDGRSVWFPNQGVGSVTRVDAGSWTVSSTIRHEAFAEPHGVVVAPDGRTVYVTSHGLPIRSPETPRDTAPAADAGPAGPGPDLRSPREDGSVAVIDVASGRVVTVTRVGPYAAAPGLAGGG